VATIDRVGTVRLDGRTIQLDMAIPPDVLLSFPRTPTGEVCHAHGLRLELHPQWPHGEQRVVWGDALCGPRQLGGRIDPSLACSPFSAQAECVSRGGCVPGSSAGFPAYDCTPYTYLSDTPYTCEAGDVSGRHGLVPAPVANLTWHDSLPLQPSEAVGRAVSFRCTGNPYYAFCAKLILATSLAGPEPPPAPPLDPPALPSPGLFGSGSHAGMRGSVKIARGRVDIAVNGALSPDGLAACRTSGIAYRLRMPTGTGTGAVCGESELGGLYDPGLSCSKVTSALCSPQPNTLRERPVTSHAPFSFLMLLPRREQGGCIYYVITM